MLWKEAGCTTELDYTKQTSWLLFLKYLDGLEQDRADEGSLEGKKHAHIVEKRFRWECWAAPKDSRAEPALRRAVIARKLSCGNRTLHGKQTWQVLARLGETCRQDAIDFIDHLP